MTAFARIIDVGSTHLAIQVDVVLVEIVPTTPALNRHQKTWTKTAAMGTEVFGRHHEFLD
jgi:hypothetical protein